MQRRYYTCQSCGFQFNGLFDRDDPHPDCPECPKIAAVPDPAAEAAADAARIASIIETGQAPAMLTHRSRAMDYAQRVAEQDFGMSDMNDSGRAGERAAKAPAPIQTAEAEAITREFVGAGIDANMAPHLLEQTKNFWQGGVPGAMGAPPPGALPGQPNAVAAASAEARAMGADPVGLLHEAGKADALGPMLNVVGAAPIGQAA